MFVLYIDHKMRYIHYISSNYTKCNVDIYIVDIYGWPKPACHFPIWLSRYTWRDLSGKHLYSINDHNNQSKTYM